MKKLLTLVAILAVVAFNVSAKTLDERIAAVETKYELRVNKVNTMRRTDAYKEVLKRHAREDADLKIQHLKDIEAVRVKAAEEKAAAKNKK